MDVGLHLTMVSRTFCAIEKISSVVGSTIVELRLFSKFPLKVVIKTVDRMAVSLGQLHGSSCFADRQAFEVIVEIHRGLCAAQEQVSIGT